MDKNKCDLRIGNTTHTRAACSVFTELWKPTGCPRSSKYLQPLVPLVVQDEVWSKKLSILQFTLNPSLILHFSELQLWPDDIRARIEKEVSQPLQRSILTLDVCFPLRLVIAVYPVRPSLVHVITFQRIAVILRHHSCGESWTGPGPDPYKKCST